jgi:hypothetical protein
MSGAIPPLLQYAFMAWCLVKHRDNFTFTTVFLSGAFSDDSAGVTYFPLVHVHVIIPDASGSVSS